MSSAAVREKLKNTTVAIPILNLPKNARVTGRATISNGADMRGESNGDRTVMDFDEQSLSVVLERLATIVFHAVIIERIDFR